MIKIKLGNNLKYLYNETLSDIEIANTWKVNAKKESDTESGLRLPQWDFFKRIHLE